jgi:hypothetical protein
MVGGALPGPAAPAAEKLLREGDENMKCVNLAALSALAVTGSALAQAPQVLATDDLCDEVIVTWNAMPNALGYKVYESAPGSFGGGCSSGGSFIGQTTNTQFVVPTGPNAPDRCYSVKTIYPSGDSPFSQPDAGTTATSARLDLVTIAAYSSEGGSATFTADASVYDTITWYKNGRVVATGVETITLTNLTIDDDGAEITVEASGPCGAVLSEPGYVFVSGAATTSPMQVHSAYRQIWANAYKTDCGGWAPSCEATDEIVSNSVADFDAELDVQTNCGSGGGLGEAFQVSSISGAELQAQGHVDGAAGGSCSMIFSDSFDTLNVYEVTFSIDSPQDYSVAGSLFSDCFICCTPPHAKLSLADASNTVIFSYEVGSMQDLGFELPIKDAGTLQPGTYTLRAEADSGGGAQFGFCSSNGPADFDFTFTIATEPGDLNGDGVVDGADLGLLLSTWGRCRGCAGDLNEDGQVNAADLGILLSLWTS